MATPKETMKLTFMEILANSTAHCSEKRSHSSTTLRPGNKANYQCVRACVKNPEMFILNVALLYTD